MEKLLHVTASKSCPGLETSKGTLAAADLTPTLPPDFPSGNQAFMGTRVWTTCLTICLEEQIARGYCNWRSRHSDDLQQCAQRTLAGGSACEMLFLRSVHWRRRGISAGHALERSWTGVVRCRLREDAVRSLQPDSGSTRRLGREARLYRPHPTRNYL